jgi:hypothetical protein
MRHEIIRVSIRDGLLPYPRPRNSSQAGVAALSVPSDKFSKKWIDSMKVKRSRIERRSGKDRRKRVNISRLFYRAREKRDIRERRSPTERRKGWVRLGKWSSAYLRDLKIAKFLIGNR